MGAMMRVRNQLAYATHEFFQSRGFLYVHTPIITAADCEGAGEMFTVTTLLDEEVTNILFFCPESTLCAMPVYAWEKTRIRTLLSCVLIVLTFFVRYLFAFLFRRKTSTR